MRIDLSSAAASVAVAVAVSFTLWWWQNRSHRVTNSSENTADTSTTANSTKDDNVPNTVSATEQRGQEQSGASKDTTTSTSMIEPASGPSTTSHTSLGSPQHAPAGGPANSVAQEKHEKNAKKVVENFQIKDIPDFTIKLDDSDNDMF